MRYLEAKCFLRPCHHILELVVDSLHGVSAHGLNDSPVGLAAYILEKFSVWTHPDNRHLPDGGLTQFFTLDELLTNVMVYWVTGSIGPSVRFYRENFYNQQFMKWDRSEFTHIINVGCNLVE